MSDHRENATAAVNIITRLEREGFGAKRKSEVLALVQVMVNSELIREAQQQQQAPAAAPVEDE